MPPKVDCPMVHVADNKIVSKSTDIFLNVIARSPSVLRASSARPAVSEKYKAAPKKVVSDLTKEQVVRMQFLNHQRNRRLWSRRGKCRFSAGLRSITYEFLTDCSGLPDARFAMLVFGAGAVSSWAQSLSGNPSPGRAISIRGRLLREPVTMRLPAAARISALLTTP